MIKSGIKLSDCQCSKLKPKQYILLICVLFSSFNLFYRVLSEEIISFLNLQTWSIPLK